MKMTDKSDEIKSVDGETSRHHGASSGSCDCGICDCNSDSSSSSSSIKVSDVKDVKVS